MLTLRTLFSGGELFGVGTRMAGWQHIDGYEIDAKIVAVAQQNGFDVRVADVCAVDYSALPYADHLHASPSCKNASQANTDADEAPEDLAAADAVCRAIAAHRGDTFSLENVWGYRNFEGFGRILAALRRAQFVYDYDHINAADYGVPQTRKRLILRAVRGRDRIPTLHPTHRQGGDMFHAPWVGWYAAIEDLIDTLPETKPAPWQLARMPKELLETTLVDGTHRTGDDLTYRAAVEPAHTIAATAMRRPGNTALAYIIEGQTGSDGAYMNVRRADCPQWTVSASMDRRPARAFLLYEQNASREATIRDGDEPAATLTVHSPKHPAPKARVAGRWVRMTVQALGRFQTVPDDYRGLTAQINGNGVPCLLAQRIMESLR